MYTTPAEYFYRAAFPRGRMLSKIEDDLTLFVNLIENLKGKESNEFNELFDKEYSKYHAGEPKTIQNHRTEMISLYGLTYTTEENIVYPTKRANRLVENEDFFEFFKIFCNKFQFPNCINKPQVTIEEMQKNINFKPAKFILELYKKGVEKYDSQFSITPTELSHLVFNDLRVLTGEFGVDQILTTLISNRDLGIAYEGGSFLTQHGREFLGYMQLADLVTLNDNGAFILNTKNLEALKFICADTKIFDIPKDFITSVETRKEITLKWDAWFGDITEDEIKFLQTNAETFDKVIEEIEVKETNEAQPIYIAPEPTQTLKGIGDLGERLVLKYEKEKIGKIRPDKVPLVQIVGNDTVLGFDIQSFEFENINRKKYIEVKTTNRTYPPEIEIFTSFPMSSNEWETARLYGDTYYIYRVFLLAKNQNKIFVVKNPVDKEQNKLIEIEPKEYRVHLKWNSGSFIE